MLYLTARGHLRSRGAHRTPCRSRRASNTLPHATRIEHLTARGAHRTPYRTRRISNNLPNAARIECLHHGVEQHFFLPPRLVALACCIYLCSYTTEWRKIRCEYRIIVFKLTTDLCIYTWWAVTTCINSTGRDCTNL